MPTVLVSGSCGFLFSNFIIYAQQETDWNLVSIDKLTHAGSLYNISYNSSVYNKRHKLYIGDVCDYHFIKKIFELEKPDIVIHGAVETNTELGESQNFISTNVGGTHSMLEAALKVHMPNKFINVSSAQIYGSIDQGNFTELDPISPQNPYASSKAASDLLGQSYFTTYGVPVITTRFCSSYGPRQNLNRLMPKAIVSVLTNKEIPLYGDGENSRELIYVKDTFWALKTLIEKGDPGQVYNIGSGQERKNAEVLDTIFRIMGSGSQLVRKVEDKVGNEKRYAVNSDKIKALGWKAMYEFDSAISHYIGWTKSNSWFWKNKV